MRSRRRRAPTWCCGRCWSTQSRRRGCWESGGRRRGLTLTRRHASAVGGTARSFRGARGRWTIVPAGLSTMSTTSQRTLAVRQQTPSAEREGFEPPGLAASRFQGGCNCPLCHRSAGQASGARCHGLGPFGIRKAMARLLHSRERCQRGRMGRPAKALTAARWSVGSNPTLSAAADRHPRSFRSSFSSRPAALHACHLVSVR